MLIKYSKKPLKKSIKLLQSYYGINKQYFRTIIKHIIMFYKNIFNPFFLNNFDEYKIQHTFVVEASYRLEHTIKRFYC